jgi:hypothetical protein
MNKYEQLIEHIINDEEDKARALFHQIVVEKSRDIYESLMDEEYAQEAMGGDQVESMVDEIAMDETDGIGEGEDDDMGDMDMGDMDMGDDDSMDDMGDDEGDLEQKVMDLESELEALKAEFEQLMGDEEGDMDDMDMDAMDMDDMDSEEDEEDEDNFAMMEAEKEEDDEKDDEKDEKEESVYESRQRRPLQKTAVDLMREYVEKISSPSNTEGQPAGTSAGGDHASVNTQSTVAGKNDMGGTAKNLAQGGSESAPDGTSAPKKGTVKDEKDASNWENKPGANAGKTFSHKAKAKAGEGQTTDGSVPVNKTSIERGGN